MQRELPIQALWAVLATTFLFYQTMAEAAAEKPGRLPDWLEFGGLVEVEAGYTDPDGGSSESTLNVTTVELGLVARINSMLSAEATLLYEDDGEQELGVDVAALTLVPAEEWSVIAGQFYLPFGVYESAMISDPLTLQLGEIRETAVMVNRESDGFVASLYGFAGDVSEGTGDEVDNFGISAGYGVEDDGLQFAASAGYINDIQDSDTIQDAVAGPAHRAGGMYASAQIGNGPLRFIAEYVGATDRIQTGEKPSALNLEVDYDLHILSYGTTIALGLQTSHDATGLGLPRSTVLAAISVGILDNTSLAFEYARSEDYSGADTDTLTAQLAVEF